MSFIASPRKIPKQSFVFLSQSVTHDVISLPLPYMSLLLSIYAEHKKKSTSRLRENVHSELYGNFVYKHTTYHIHPLKVVILVVFLFSFSHFIFFLSFCYHDERWCIFMFVDALHKFVSLSFLTWYRTWWFDVKWNEAFLVICCCNHHDFSAIENHCDKCDRTCNFL